MRVLRVLDTRSHLLQQPAGLGFGSSRLSAAAAAAAAAAGGGGGGSARVSSGSGLEGWGSQGSLSGPLSRTSSGVLSQQQQQQQIMSRSSSTASLVGKANTGQQQQQQAAGSGSNGTQAAAAMTAGVYGRFPAGDKHQMLRKLAAYLLAPLQSYAATPLLTTGSSSSSGDNSSSSSSSTAVVNIVSPSVDIQVQLQGFGISLVSETRELLYGCCRGLNARFSQDAVRRAVGFTVGSIRVENTLYGCQYPLLLASPVSRSVFGVVVHSPAGLARRAAAAAAAGSSSSEVQQAAAAATRDADLAAGDDEDAAAASCKSVWQQQTAAASGVSSGAAAAAAAATTALANGSTTVEGASQAAAAASAALAAAAQLLQQQQPAEHQQQQQQPPPMLLPHQLAFGVLATVWRTQPSGVLCVEQLGVQVSPCALSLEGKHLKQLVDFVQSLQAAAAADAAADTYPLPGSRGLAQLKPSAAAALQPVLPPSLPAASAGKRGVKLYFEQWQMSAITLCVSFAPDSWFDPLPGGATAAAAAAGAVKGLDSSSSSSSSAAVTGSSSSAGEALAGMVATADSVGAAAAAALAAAESSATAAGGSVQDTQQHTTAAAAVDTSSTQHLPDRGNSSSSSVPAALAEQHSSSSSSSGAAPLPVWLQMALALAHAEEGAWLTLGSFERSHTMINTDSLVQVRTAAYSGVSPCCAWLQGLYCAAVVLSAATPHCAMISADSLVHVRTAACSVTSPLTCTGARQALHC
jgi:hypothetical protein